MADQLAEVEITHAIQLNGSVKHLNPMNDELMLRCLIYFVHTLSCVTCSDVVNVNSPSSNVSRYNLSTHYQVFISLIH